MGNTILIKTLIMRNTGNLFLCLVLTFTALLARTDIYAQKATMCYSSNGAHIPCGSSWTEYRNGIAYTCTCNCSRTPPAQCVPSSSGSAAKGGIPVDKTLESFGEINNLLNKLNEKPVNEIDNNKLKQQEEENMKNQAVENAKYESASKLMKKLPDQKQQAGNGLTREDEKAGKDHFGLKPIPVMGSSPLTAEERERMRAYNLKTIPDNSLDKANFSIEESPFWTTPEMIQLGTDALKFSVGFVSGGYTAVAGVDVVSGILNKKSGQEIIYKIAEDFAIKRVGDVVGYGVQSGKVAISGIGFKTGVFSGESAKQDFEFATQGVDMLKDTWAGIKPKEK
jgi:hypothetical protein